MIAALVAGLALAAGPATAHEPPAAAMARGAEAARGAAVGLGLREWAITVYRPKVPPGVVRFNMTNRGEDGHNLEVRGPHGFRSRVSADAAPGGGHATLTVRLRRRGTYRLLCEKPGHAKLGMRATLRVVRPAS